MTIENEIQTIESEWAENPRWKGVKRGYTAADVVRLRGTVEVDGLVVAPAYRRRKIAERLLHWAVERAGTSEPVVVAVNWSDLVAGTVTAPNEADAGRPWWATGKARLAGLLGPRCRP